ncbi:glycoside hydrolase family 3 C-terminal domain-containing protein [Sphingomonas nostoxanthinifaciens]|uniref:glycoside hydrolase family 3 C-terminal domain-containing protein n=1 Tax=Sphingomonas nostoxanthinifaciens TaxID=2872652 RepID=UPI001CC1E975|nr:glycoside hydrolase family 3 C-terminal domain-containing protein [Sphingomonas nostoxanthinifaciens]UAK23240.1 glycoside hydrolase family 3 C-terminal domain-containing protein [Sphingomonas nostoxanthinifaciens]
MTQFPDGRFSARAARRFALLIGTAGAALAGIATAPLQAQPTAPPSAERATADRLAAAIVARMTTAEKLPQLLNVAPAIPRLDIPAYNWWTESLHGAIGTVATTNFPEPIGLAASFDAPLVHDVAGTISVEVRALHTLGRQTGKLGRIGTGLDTWSPNINIFRDPRWGRGQETYGEDPFLTAGMGVAFVTGMQGPDPDRPLVIATPKHFAVHSGPESTRHEANVYVSSHDLEDTYLPAFRAAIVQGQAGSIMCAYNRIDGQPACANDLLLKEHLRGAWGFQGYVVSDCDAVKDVADNHHYAPDQATAVAASVKAGVDNECNVRTVMDIGGLPERFGAALDRHFLAEADIDRSLVRLFSARIRNGDLPGLPMDAGRTVPVSAIGTPAHGNLAVRAAEESLVLLKNDGVLPLRSGARIAVIGPLGDATRVLRGNYSSTLSAPPVSVVEGLRRAAGAGRVTLVPFSPSITDGDRVPTSALRTADGKPGLTARYFNPVTPPTLPFAPGAENTPIAFQDAPVVTVREPDVGSRNLTMAQVNDYHRTEWTGYLVPPATGSYRLGLSGNGLLELDGKTFLDVSADRPSPLPTFKTITLQQGHRYRLRVVSSPRGFGGTDLVWKRVAVDADAELAAAARKADVLVAVVGLTSDLEAEETGVKVPGFEGGDKTSLDLPPEQVALLERAKATGKPLIVIAMNGSPINLAWAKDNAAAIVEAWYPGQSGGTAVANVLTGRTNPAGRLPLTFYRSVDDLPAFTNYAMDGRTYRYFTGTPVYPFGYGLSFTSFSYGPLTVTPAAAGAETGLRVTTEIANTGKRAGDEVAQLYLNFPDTPGAPRIALRGFQRLTLKPGEHRTVTFDLTPRDLSAVAVDGARQVMAGRYSVSVGSGQPGTNVPGQSAQFAIARSVPLPM